MPAQHAGVAFGTETALVGVWKQHFCNLQTNLCLLANREESQLSDSLAVPECVGLLQPLPLQLVRLRVRNVADASQRADHSQRATVGNSRSNASFAHVFSERIPKDPVRRT